MEVFTNLPGVVVPCCSLAAHTFSCTAFGIDTNIAVGSAFANCLENVAAHYFFRETYIVKSYLQLAELCCMLVVAARGCR